MTTCKGRVHFDKGDMEDYPIGLEVRTVQPKVPTTGWTQEALHARRWNVTGIITARHDSHGLCYDVRHDDGTSGAYEPHELLLSLPMVRVHCTSKEQREACTEIVRKLMDCGPKTAQELAFLLRRPLVSTRARLEFLVAQDVLSYDAGTYGLCKDLCTPMKILSFAAYETIGIGIPNPRAVTRWLIPAGLSPEQLEAIEREIDRINAELEAQEQTP